MKRVVFTLCVLVLATMFGLRVRVKSNPILTLRASAQAPNPACVPPMQVASSTEQTAWQLFVAATCPVNNAQYPLCNPGNWTEQNQLYGVPGAVKALGTNERPRFHMSPLARIMQEKRKGKKAKKPEMLLPEAANQDCNSNTWSKRTICEEARLNSEAQNYVTSEKLATKQDR